MPNNFGRVLSHAPASVAAGTALTLTAPAGGAMKFLRGATFVTFKLGQLVQVTVLPSAVRHISDHEVILDFPQVGAGVYECHVASGLDLAQTASPVIGAGMAPGKAPGEHGRILKLPAAQGRSGDTVTISAPADSPFVFDPWTTAVTFGGNAGAVYQVTVPPIAVAVADSNTVRVPVPQLPPGSYGVTVSSAGASAETVEPFQVLPGGAGASRPATPASNPMIAAPTGATSPHRLTVNTPFTREPVPPGPVFLGPGSPPMYPSVTPPGAMTRLGLFFSAMVVSFLPSAMQPRGRRQAAPPTAPPKMKRKGKDKAAARQSPSSAAEAAVPAEAVLPAAPSHYRTGNAVEYLIDGAAYFQRLAEVCDEAAGLPGSAGYVHMALRSCDVETALEGGGKRFIDKIRALGSAKKEVKLLLWGPGAAQGPMADVKRVNARAKQQIEALNLPSVEVQLLSHPLPFGSHHQSMVIAGLGDYSKVLISGMDVQPEPRDDAPHGDGSRWHDAGVLIAGPATTDAEESWDAWWTSAGGKAARRPPPVLDAGKQSVFIAQTAPPRAAIREELVARIQMAEDFVYLENYGIYDPAVITALGQKLKSKRDAGREFEALLLVPHQSLAPQYAWLHYVTYCHLSFMSCSSFSFVEGPNTYTVSKAVDGKTAWSFDYAGGAFGIGNWYEDSTVSWDTGSTSIRNIRAFTGETLMFTLGSARAGNPNEFDHVYLHGKVAIIDDAFAMVGSASFTPRSLVQDGEVAAFIHGDSVASFRAALWSEYFGGSAPAAAGFGAGARANHGSAAGGKLTAGQLYVMPLQFSVPQKEPRGVESWLGTELR